jgi:hypothetical protein
LIIDTKERKMKGVGGGVLMGMEWMKSSSFGWRKYTNVLPTFKTLGRNKKE